MRVTVITSCTGSKSLSAPEQLTKSDFEKGKAHVQARQALMSVLPAQSLYIGAQHVRLMRGVKAARERGIDVKLWIVSAGYGLVPGEQLLAPYELSFNTMTLSQASTWARDIGIPEALASVVAEPADRILMLLGERYLKAAGVADITAVGGPCWALCSEQSARLLPGSIQPILLTKQDTRRFRMGLVGLKGEVAARILESPSVMPAAVTGF